MNYFLIIFASLAIFISSFLTSYFLTTPASQKNQFSNQNKTQEAGAKYSGSDKLGLCDGFSNRTITDDIQDTKALGFAWGRPFGDVFSQDSIEKQKGSYDFSSSDAVVKEMQSGGLKIFGTLFPTGTPQIPENIDLQSFANYVKAVVGHYKGKITYWQVGIEPFCKNLEETCYKNFSDLVKTAYSAAKSVDSGVMISPGGPGPIFTPQGNVEPMSSSIFKYLFENGGGNYMDFFNFHFLVGAKNQDIKNYIDYWKKYVPAGKEIWLSETGSRDVGDKFTISYDASVESTWVRMHINDSFQNGVSKIFWCRAEHSFSDMPKVVETLVEKSKEYGGSPTGGVVKRQTERSPQQGTFQLPH